MRLVMPALQNWGEAGECTGRKNDKLRGKLRKFLAKFDGRTSLIPIH